MLQATSKISSKGQVVIPLEIRKQLGVREGDSLKFTLEDNGALRLEVLKRDSILDLFGSVQAKGDTQDILNVIRESKEDRIEQLRKKMDQ